MKLTVQQIYDAVPIISQIIRDKRVMPLKGKYRLARMHAKLLPEFNTADAARSDLIKAYDTHMKIEVEDPETHERKQIDGDNWIVPDDKMPEFTASWKQIADQEIEVDVEPMPLAQLDMGDDVNGAIEAGELITLGALVSGE